MDGCKPLNDAWMDANHWMMRGCMRRGITLRHAVQSNMTVHDPPAALRVAWGDPVGVVNAAFVARPSLINRLILFIVEIPEFLTDTAAGVCECW